MSAKGQRFLADTMWKKARASGAGGGPRFLADIMLQKAGRWLRILGFDVEFPESEDDDKIMEQAKRRGLVLLTRDEELVRRAHKAGVAVFMVTKVHNARQVAEIMRRFGLKIGQFPSRTRCPSCNGRLKEVEGKEEVRGKVPRKSFAAHDQFWLCKNCGQVFWEGSHWGRINREVERIRRELEKPEAGAKAG